MLGLPVLSDLYFINVNLVSIAHVWKDFGLALGLRESTLRKIQQCYHLHQIDRCFTEVIAAWLNGEDRSQHSPEPSWQEIISALKSLSLNTTDCIYQFIMELKSKNSIDASDNINMDVRSGKVNACICAEEPDPDLTIGK